MIYTLTDEGKALTWLAWCKKGGCGLSGYASGEVGKKLIAEGKRFDLSAMTLGEIAEKSVLAGREIARFAATRWPPLGLAKASVRNEITDCA